MQNIVVKRYSNKETQKFWQGWIEPEDKSWILFINVDGRVFMYDKRCQETGAVL